MFSSLFTRLAAPALLGALLASCGGPAQVARLPYLGEPEVQAPGDTVWPRIPAFNLLDQQGQAVTNQTLAPKVYVSDFFFATCPGICPKMQSELLKVYKQYAANPSVAFVSHTIDPEHDSLPVLRDYARRLGVATPGSSWHFVRGATPHPTRTEAYALARAYFTGAETDTQAPGGIAHNGVLALVDDRGYVRGLYDGLNPQQTEKLIQDIPVLLSEVKTRHPEAGK